MPTDAFIVTTLSRFRLHDASERRKQAERPKPMNTKEAKKAKLSSLIFGEGKNNYEEGKKLFSFFISRGEEGKNTSWFTNNSEEYKHFPIRRSASSCDIMAENGWQSKTKSVVFSSGKLFASLKADYINKVL